jgi:hypothetical protein
MSGTVVIVIAALLGWCVISVVLALLVGRRLRGGGPQITSGWTRPAKTKERQRQDRMPAA